MRRLARRSAALCGVAAALWLVSPSAAQEVPTAESCEVPGAAPADAAQSASGELERGNALAAEGRHAEALAAYEAGRRRADARGETALALLATANAARAAVDAGQSEGVEARLAEVTGAISEVPDPATRARILLHAGRTSARLAEQGHRERESLQRAARSFAAAREQALAAGDASLRSYADGYLAELYERRGRNEEAARLTRRALLASQEVGAGDARFRWQWQLGRLERAAGREAAALAAYRAAVRAQSDLQGGSEFALHVEPLYHEYVDLLLRDAARRPDPATRQALLTEVRDALEDLKASELRDYFRDPCLDAQRKATPDAIPGTVVVYPVLLPDRTELIVSRGSRLTSQRVEIDRETLTERTRAFRRALERRNSRTYRSLANELYDWLIRPIEAEIAAAGPEATLVFVPDGPLRTIPFGALRDRESRQFLIEKIPIAVTPSLTLTDPRRIETETTQLLAAGISDAVGGYPELESVEAEIEAIRELFPGRTLMNDGFGVEALQQELETTPFGIVHIASHGEFGGDAAENFLLAYDGRVSMDRLASLVGATQFRAEQPLELLTLSACESAAGDDRAALGLAGLAVRSGARSALASLWSVNDRATADLVVEFYQQLREPQRSRAQALQIAQVKMLKTRHYRHPGYWAPFMLISSWL